MKAEEFKPKQKVAYIPSRAGGDINHPDVEFGQVSRTNETYVFVKFEPQLSRFGWDKTSSQACNPEDLKVI